MDGGKRDAGRVPADVAGRLPGTIVCRDYEEFVALSLNVERVRMNHVSDLLLALKIASNEVPYPREWRKYDGEDGS